MELTTEIKNRFADLLCAMSPENLTGDGEVPPHIVEQRRLKLWKEWQALEKQVGQKVSQDEAWEWENNFFL